MSFTINAGKELAQAPRSVILADFTFSDGSVWRASTLGGTYGGNTYVAALADENLERLQFLSEQGIDRIPSVKIVIADATKSLYATWERGADKGFRGATVLLRLALRDVSAAEWSTDSVVPFIGVCDQPDVDEKGLTVSAQNKLNLAPYQLPIVPITARCPWINPSTTDQRTEAADANSRFYRCGETRDLVTAPPCSYTKQTCTQPTHYGGSTWQPAAQTDSGRNYLAGQNVAWTNPDTSGKFRSYWPEVLGGTAWIDVPVLNQWADGNYSRGEAGVGIGPIEVLEVAANGVKLDQEGTGGSADYRWHYVNDGSRAGAHNVDTGYSGGDVYGNETVIQFLAPHSTIDPSTLARVRVKVRRATASASIPIVSASASGGLIRVDFTGSAPADGPGDGRLVRIVGNSWSVVNGSFNVRYYDSPVTDHVFLEGTSATGSGTGGTLYYDANYVGSGGAIPTAALLQQALRATGRWSDANFGTTWAGVTDLCAAFLSFTDQDGVETSQMRFSSAIALTERRSASDIVRGLRQSIGALLYIGEDGKLEISIEGPLAEQQPSAVDGSNYDTPIASTLRDGSSADGCAAYRFDESNCWNLKRAAQSNSTTPNKVVFPFVDPANGFAVSTFAEVDPEDVSRLDQETSGGLQVQPEGIASYNHAYRVARLGLAKILRGNPAGDTRGTDWWQWETSFRACKLRLQQLVLLNDVDLGLSDQLVRITGIQPSRNYENVTITAHHHEDAWYLDAPSTLADPGRSFYQFVPPGPVVANPLRLRFSGGAGQVGVAYSAALLADFGVLPYAFSILSGSLPAGLSLNTSTGVISGTPTTAGTYPFTARVTDSAVTPVTADVACSINVQQPSGASIAATISSLSATDSTGDRWQDQASAVHAVVAVAIACSSYPQVVTIETTSPQYGRINHGWFLVTASMTIKIGAQTTNTSIYPPTGATSETVTVRVALGTYDAAAPLSGVSGVSSTTVSVAGPPTPGATEATEWYVTTAAPTYSTGPGGASMFGFQIRGKLPITAAAGLNFKAARLCFQTGKYVGGVWTPGGQQPNTPSATDSKTFVGDYAGPTAVYVKEDHADNVKGDPSTGLIIWDEPNLWTVPSDGYEIFRFVLFVESVRSGGTWTQQNAWSAAAGTSTPGTNANQELTVDGTKSAVTEIGITDGAGADVVISPGTTGVLVEKTIAGVTHYGQLKYDGIAINDGTSTTSIGPTTADLAGGKFHVDANGLLTKYENTALAGKGQAFIVYRDKQINQTGTAHLTPTVSAGLYRLSVTVWGEVTGGSPAGSVLVSAYACNNNGVANVQDPVAIANVMGSSSYSILSAGSLSFASGVFYTDGAIVGSDHGLGIYFTVGTAWSQANFNWYVILERLDD